MENYTFVLTPANRKITLNYCKLEEKYQLQHKTVITVLRFHVLGKR